MGTQGGDSGFLKPDLGHGEVCRASWDLLRVQGLGNTRMTWWLDTPEAGARPGRGGVGWGASVSVGLGAGATRTGRKWPGCLGQLLSPAQIPLTLVSAHSV